MQHNEAMIFVVQAGFLGLWGEWHHSLYDNGVNSKSYLIRKLLEKIPPSRKLQVREAHFKGDAEPAFSGWIDLNANSSWTYLQFPALTSSETARIGFHNDYFVLDQGPSEDAQWDYRYPDYDFYKVRDEGPYTTVDGEMPYSFAFGTIAYGDEGGWYAARRMRAHSYSSFSIVHNWEININAWKSHLLYPYQFRNDGTLVTDDYFNDQFGYEVPRTAFEYIRDHLGYRFQLRTGKIPVRSAKYSSAHFEFAIKNFGFSRMVNSRPIYFVLIDQNNNVKELLTDVDAQNIYPTYGQDDGIYTIVKDVYLDDSYTTGQYRVGLWMPDASANLKFNPIYSVKLANGNIQWWQDPSTRYLVNVLGSFEVF